MGSKKVIVVGAGAAGMFAAGTAAANGYQVRLLEKNDQPGRKLRITGKGRCNLTNACDISEFISNVCGNGRFLYSAVSRFGPRETMDFFEGLGVRLKTERGKRVFPVSDQSGEIVEALSDWVRKSGAVTEKRTVTGITRSSDGTFTVDTDMGKLTADAVVIATGGASYPQTGSTGDGYIFAQKLGHTIIPPKASLVPLVSPDTCCRKLMGLSLRNVAVKVRDNAKNTYVYEDFGELLFTHFGLSGPVVLSASAHLRNIMPGKYTFCIDLKPGLTVEQLDARLLRDFQKYSNRDLSHSFGDLLPRTLIPVFLSRLPGIPHDLKVNRLTREGRQDILKLLKCFEVVIDGTRPLEEAVVTAGGVSVREVNPKTMESRICPNLYFAGEVLDVDAYTGGFNLQIAFSTGYVAGQLLS